jgi:hypothetical protein
LNEQVADTNFFGSIHGVVASCIVAKLIKQKDKLISKLLQLVTCAK